VIGALIRKTLNTYVLGRKLLRQQVLAWACLTSNWPSDANDIVSRLGRPHPALLKEVYAIMRGLVYCYSTLVSLEVTCTS